jgi:hypothetical protein
MTFPEMLADANETRTGRSPGQWTPAACRVWREADPEMARLLEAARGNGCRHRRHQGCWIAINGVFIECA